MTKAYLEPQEIELMAKATRCVRDMLLILLLFYLGCRHANVGVFAHYVLYLLVIQYFL